MAEATVCVTVSVARCDTIGNWSIQAVNTEPSVRQARQALDLVAAKRGIDPGDTQAVLGILTALDPRSRKNRYRQMQAEIDEAADDGPLAA
jgi:hypothetical protein